MRRAASGGNRAIPSRQIGLGRVGDGGERAQLRVAGQRAFDQRVTAEQDHGGPVIRSHSCERLFDERSAGVLAFRRERIRAVHQIDDGQRITAPAQFEAAHGQHQQQDNGGAQNKRGDLAPTPVPAAWPTQPDDGDEEQQEEEGEWV